MVCAQALRHGAGLPIAGRAGRSGGFIAAVVGRRLLFRDHPAQMIASVIPPTIIFLVIAAKTTRGGLRWRWGGNDPSNTL